MERKLFLLSLLLLLLFYKRCGPHESFSSATGQLGLKNSTGVSEVGKPETQHPSSQFEDSENESRPKADHGSDGS